jgi:hypothetical protein
MTALAQQPGSATVAQVPCRSYASSTSSVDIEVPDDLVDISVPG